jgi:ABC-type spermidine/putrescine transport system permease subunit II
MKGRTGIPHPGLALATALMLVFALGPIVTIVTFSFNTSRFYSLPIQGLTLRWYLELLNDARIWSSLFTSVEIAAAVTILATTLGTAFAFFVVRARGRFRMLVTAIGFLPLIVPVLVVAAGLQVAFVKLDLPLGYVTVIFGHTIYATPFVTLMVIAQLFRYDPALDAAARDLGAGAAQTLMRVTLPILWPSIRSGAILAFLLSFNEWAIAFFTGRGFNTLPMLVYSMQRNGLPPTVLAYSSLSVLVVVVLASVILPFAFRILRATETNG